MAGVRGYSAHTPARGGAAARGIARLGRLKHRPAQQKRGCARLPGRCVEPSTHLQTQRARLAHNRGQRPRMQSFFHDAQDLGVLPAIDPHDAGRVETEARQPWRIAIGAARCPQHISLAAAQNACRHRCGESRHRGRKFSLQPVRPELVKRAKLQAAPWKRRIHPRIRKRQNEPAFRNFQMMAFKGADLHP